MEKISPPLHYSEIFAFVRTWSDCAQPWLTLCHPMNSSLPGCFVHGIFQARIPEWVAIPSFRESSWPRDRTRVSCTASGFRTREPGLRTFDFQFTAKLNPMGSSHDRPSSVLCYSSIFKDLSDVVWCTCPDLFYRCLNCCQMEEINYLMTMSM